MWPAQVRNGAPDHDTPSATSTALRRIGSGAARSSAEAIPSQFAVAGSNAALVTCSTSSASRPCRSNTSACSMIGPGFAG